MSHKIKDPKLYSLLNQLIIFPQLQNHLNIVFSNASEENKINISKGFSLNGKRINKKITGDIKKL